MKTIVKIFTTLVTPFVFITVLGFVIGLGVGLFSVGYQLAGAITNLLK